MFRASLSTFINRFSAHSVRPFHSTMINNDIFKIQDEQDFKDKVIDGSSKKLVVLDFYATWCGPCRQLTPRLENIVGQNVDEVDLAKVDVDELDALAAEYQVQSIPAVFAIKNKKIVDQFVGLKDEDQLKTFIDGALNK